MAIETTLAATVVVVVVSIGLVFSWERQSVFSSSFAAPTCQAVFHLAPRRRLPRLRRRPPFCRNASATHCQTRRVERAIGSMWCAWDWVWWRVTYRRCCLLVSLEAWIAACCQWTIFVLADLGTWAPRGHLLETAPFVPLRCSFDTRLLTVALVDDEWMWGQRWARWETWGTIRWSESSSRTVSPPRRRTRLFLRRRRRRRRRQNQWCRCCARETNLTRSCTQTRIDFDCWLKKKEFILKWCQIVPANVFFLGNFGMGVFLSIRILDGS